MFLVIVIILLKFMGTFAWNCSQTDQITYPPMWNNVPSNLNEYPIENSTRIIDPWLYSHRLGLYKILISTTNPLMPFCSISNASNILFGLPSQFGWQYKSNRLFSNGTLNISVSSWWASGNYYLSVVPFLAAVDAGLISQQNFRIIRRENFCINQIECSQQAPNAMKQWRKFFARLQRIKTNFNDESLDQDYLGPLWRAYKASIDEALPIIQAKFDGLPSNLERLFAYGWSHLLNLIAMTRKNTNLYETLKNQRRFLPHRLLRETDRNNFSTDLSSTVMQSLEVLFTFRYERLSTIEKFWQKLTCNYQGRIYCQRILELLAKSKLQAFKTFVFALVNAIFFQCDHRSNVDL